MLAPFFFQLYFITPFLQQPFTNLTIPLHFAKSLGNFRVSLYYKGDEGDVGYGRFL